MSSQAKKHNQAFLDLVNDAKSRVREINIDQYQQMKYAGEDHILVDVREDSEWAAGHAAGAMHLGKGVIERDIENESSGSKTRSWCCIAAADSVRRWRRTICRRWAIRMSSRSMAAGARTLLPDYRSRR